MFSIDGFNILIFLNPGVLFLELSGVTYYSLGTLNIYGEIKSFGVTLGVWRPMSCLREF